MTRPERMLRRAAMAAAQGTYRWRVGCVIAIGSSVLSSGVNKFRHRPDLDHLRATFHAEEVAIRRTKGGKTA